MCNLAGRSDVSWVTAMPGTTGTGGEMGDTSGFDALYAASVSRLTGQLYLLTGDREEARDCVQDAFERAWLRWERIAATEDPEAWIRTVARRLAISRWRKVRNAGGAWRRRHHGQDVHDDHAGPSSDRLALVEALQHLPVAQRTAIVLHHLCDLDVAAVAAETGTGVSAVKSQLARGRRALAELLDETTESTTARARPDATSEGRPA